MFLDRNIYKEEQRSMVDYLNEHYEYCYLESMHYINSHQKTDTIITGLSYGLSGIESNLLSGNVLNLSMNSQDLYYDFLHIKRAVADAKGSISTCIITLGYYSFFYDLSRGSLAWKSAWTYMPLFSDTHHANYVDLDTLDFTCSDECRNFYHSFFEENPSFWGKAMLREHMCKTITEKGGWAKLSASERDREAYELVQKHNHHIIHEDTCLENIIIFRNMISFLVANHIRPIVAILPFSKEYLKYINPSYKEVLMTVLEELPDDILIDFIDMNEIDIFTDEDILDSNHVNHKGALKATKIMNGIINHSF